MSDRLIYHVEFSKRKEEEVKMYVNLKSFSNPPAIIKDILMGKLDVSVLGIEKIEKEKKDNG